MSKRSCIPVTLLALGLAATAPALAEEEPNIKTDMSKGGITFSSGDNSLTIGARAQFRWTVDDKDQFDADTVGSGVGKEDGVSSSFDVPRMRLIFKGGMFKPWLKYELQFELSRTTGDNSSKVKDAAIEIVKNEMAAVKVGQFKTPFSLQELTSSGRQEFVDRAITNLKFAPAREMGVQLSGVTEDKKFGYAVGAFNGSGESHVQDDQGHLYVGRVWFDPLGQYVLAESAVDGTQKNIFHVGVAYRTGEVIRGTATPGVFEDPDNEKAANLELAWRNARWFATGEYFDMKDEQKNPTAGPDVDSKGWHAQAGFMAIPKALEFGLRYAQIDPDKDVDNDHLTELRGVAGYYWKGHNLKLQADLGQLKYEAAYGSLPALALRGLPALGNRLVTGQDLTDKQFRVQLQLAF